MCSLPGVLLLLLTGAASAEEPWIQESPAQLWLSPGATAELSCNISGSTDRANWYREKPDGSLEWIYESTAASKPKGKYSGMMRARGIFPLNISNVQREDSGYYYCTSSVSHSQFGKGTRLLVTDASEPKLSILVPVDTEEPSDFVSLLCHLPGAWNLTWVSGKHWDGAMNCTATERGTGRIVSETIGTARVRVRGAGALRSPFPAPALPEAAHACGLRAAKTREERESGGILRSAAFPCWAAWQRGRRNAESAAGSSMAMRNPMQIIKLLYATRVSQLHWDCSLCYPV
ncbi:M1-specific T cell receptor beta chain-like isoform X2 [Anas acuta]|uniref:M1-specific T cell receptor beta chain-like isoform X1 n=1 Tax=Anas acuta TaxID=28680 RepID=UPI0035C8998A